MAEASDKEFALARVYGGAMFELAEAQGQADAMLEELLDLVTVLDGNPEFETFLASPMVDPEVRRASIQKIFRGRASDLLVDSLQVLNRKDRAGILRSVVEAYRLAHQDRRGVVDVHVRTATALTDSLRDRLKTVTGEFAGKEARLVETVDESIIAGVVIRIGDRQLDTSVSTRLRKLADSLAERASVEAHEGGAYVIEAG